MTDKKLLYLEYWLYNVDQPFSVTVGSRQVTNQPSSPDIHLALGHTITVLT